MNDIPEGYVQVPAQFAEIRVLRLAPGDVLVLRHEQRLMDKEIDEIRANTAAALDGHKCIVLDGGLTLDALLRKEGD